MSPSFPSLRLVGIFTLLLDILVALNKKATGADSGIVDFIARTRLHELDKQADNFAWRIKLAAFLPALSAKYLIRYS